MKEDNSSLFIRRNDEEILSIEDDSQGRGGMILYMTGTEERTADVFQVGISWKSLGKLRKRMERKEFDWEVADKSFGITSRNGTFELRFKALDTGMSVSLVLSQHEVEALKSCLFRGLECGPSTPPRD